VTRIKAWAFGVLQRFFRSRGMELAAAGTEDRLAELSARSSAPPITGVGRLLVLQEVDLVLDVGAAVGMYGRSLRDNGYQGRICSFEPLSGQFQRLEEQSSGDPLWEARNVALGPAAGTAEINVAGNFDSSSLLPMGDRHAEAAPTSVYVGTETVEVATIDSVWDEIAGDARKPFLKLDVQGFELEALAGAERTLPKLCGIQAELSFVPLYEGAPLWLEVVEFLAGKGFHVAGVEGGYTDQATGEMLQADGIFIRG
jgi:FkbM family methyltransferase